MRTHIHAGEHRNIIGFRDVFVDEDYYYIVMEMAEGGELFDRLVEQVRYMHHCPPSLSLSGPHTYNDLSISFSFFLLHT